MPRVYYYRLRQAATEGGPVNSSLPRSDSRDAEYKHQFEGAGVHARHAMEDTIPNQDQNQNQENEDDFIDDEPFKRINYPFPPIN